MDPCSCCFGSFCTDRVCIPTKAFFFHPILSLAIEKV